MRNKFWLFILVGICTILWGVCLIQVVFLQKTLFDEQTHVSATVSYPSTYNSSAAIHLVSSIRSTRHDFSIPTITLPKASMQSTSNSITAAPIRIRTLSSQRVSVVGGGGANTPASSAANSGSSSSRGIVYAQASIPSVQGFITSASYVSGGTTSSETYERMVHGSAPKRSPGLPDGVCEECQWVWDEEAGDWVCSVCGAHALDGCEHEAEHGYCWCPIGDGWPVYLFLAVLALTYALFKKKSLRITDLH